MWTHVCTGMWHRWRHLRQCLRAEEHCGQHKGGLHGSVRQSRGGGDSGGSMWQSDAGEQVHLQLSQLPFPGATWRMLSYMWCVWSSIISLAITDLAQLSVAIRIKVFQHYHKGIHWQLLFSHVYVSALVSSDLYSIYAGGLVVVALDLLGMTEYARINPRLRVLDTLYGLLVESDVIATEVTERCEIEFSLSSRNLQIILSARTSNDEEFCSDTSSAIADIIDNPQRLTSFFPESFQFAAAAVTGLSGASRLMIHSSLFLCTIVLSTVGLMFY